MTTDSAEQNLNRVTLVYQDTDGTEYTQPLGDITDVGTLIDPLTGDDLELVGARIAGTDSNAIVLGADAIRAEVTEAADVHNLTSTQVEHITNDLTDEEIETAINTEVDDDFWTEYDDVRSRVIAQLASDPLICIISLDGDDYEHAVDEANAAGGSTEAVVAHLSKWDYGEENDSAADALSDHTELDELETLPHQLHEVDHDETRYWVLIDHGLRFYALYRRPMN